MILPIRIIRKPRRALEFINRANHLCRVSCDHGTGWNIFGDYGTGANKDTLADGDKRKQGGINADLSASLDCGAAHALSRVFTARMDVIGNSNARGHENFVFNGRKLRDIAVAVNFDAISDLAAIVHNGIRPDGEMLSDEVFLADHHIMARCQIMSNGCAFIDGCATADLRIVANDKSAFTDFPARGIREEHLLIHQGIFSNRT